MALEDFIRARPVSVVTPMLSSLGGLVRRYIVGLFPPNYFKDFYISTEYSARPGRVLRGRFRPMEGSNISQRKYPFLSVRVDPTAEVSPLGSLDSYWMGRKFLRDPTQLTGLLYDDEGLRYCGYEKERMICRFSVTALLPTDLLGYEVQAYLKRTIPIDRTVFLQNASISTEIPHEILLAIWNDMDLGDGSVPGDMAQFSSYLRSMTGGGVLQTVNSATGRHAFSFEYSANPVMRVSGPPSFTVNRDGGVVRWSQVEFQAELDLPVPIGYSYRQEARLSGTPGVTPPIGSISDSKAVFGLTFHTRPPSTINTVLQLSYLTGIVTGEPDPALPGADDVTDLSLSVPTVLKNYVANLLLRPVPSDVLQARLARDGTDLDSSLWTMDWVAWKLHIHWDGLLYNETYVFTIYVDAGDFSQLTPDGRGRFQAPSPYYSVPAT